MTIAQEQPQTKMAIRMMMTMVIAILPPSTWLLLSESAVFRELSRNPSTECPQKTEMRMMMCKASDCSSGKWKKAAARCITVLGFS